MNIRKLKRIIAELDRIEPACTHNTLKSIIADYEYNGHIIKDANLYYCTTCGEHSYNRSESRRWQKMIEEKSKP